MNFNNVRTRIAIALVGAAGAGAAYLGLRETETSLRKKVVRAAASQMGRSDPTPYWIDVMGAPQAASISWCGAFALWALHQAGLAKFKNWIPGFGFLLTQPMPLEPTGNPKPGDIAFFTAYQHQAVISSVLPNGTMTLINGNGENRSVTPSQTAIGNATAIYSIQPYIEQKLRGVG